MSVPNTNTFSLTDVGTEIGLSSPYSLQDCFDNAIASGFDPTYEGAKNSLYNFRNYNHIQRSENGYLYNRLAFDNVNFAPSGWHIPTQTEVTDLTSYLTTSIAGGKLKETGFAHWDSPNTGATNESGFTAFGSGYRTSAGVFTSFKLLSIIASQYVNCLLLQHNSAVGWAYTSIYNNAGISVRFIKDNSTNPGTVSDYDGNIYDCVKIGTQVWTKQNWKCTRLNNGTLIPTVTDNTAWANLTTLGKCAYNNDENNV